MSSNDPRIQPLPSDVAAKVKSSTSITHLSEVIIALVKNSLDANADSVFVTVDFQRGGCVVEDDGDGILPAEFEPGGGLGKAHHTSKSQPGENEYSRKGLFLASLACLSLLTITSRHVRHQSTNTVILHNSTAVARLVPAPVQQRLKFSRHGTRVTVNDLFGNMPVRVKSRALALQKPDDLEREWDHLKYLLVSLMLANDGLRKLVLEDSGKGKKLTIRCRAQSLSSSPSQGSELDIHRINSIFAQTNMIDRQIQDRWNIISAGIPNISVHAAISLVPSPTKKAQFISFGTEPLFLLNSTNVLYGEINRLFALSDFGTISATSAHSEIGTRGRTAQSEQDTTAKIPTKTINRWPMFYIRINTGLPQAFYDDNHEFLPESDKSIQHIVDVLAVMIYEFLRQQNLRPRTAKRDRKTSQLSEGPNVDGLRDVKKLRCTRLERPGVPASSTEESFDGRLKLPTPQKRAPIQSQDFGTWSRVKGINGTSANVNGARRPGPCKPVESGRKNNMLYPPDAGHGNLADDCSPLEDIPTSINLPEQAPPDLTENNGSGSADAVLPWVDPYTGKSHFINARTGQSMGSRTASLGDSRPHSTGSIRPIRSLSSRRPATAIPSGSQGLWIENILKKWDNPAFRRSERPLASTDVGTGHDHACGKSGAHDGSGSLEATGYAKFRGKLRRQHLELAEVIAQVDRKFIFAKMKAACYHAGDDSSDTVLALIDQHAADERCRVERLFEELFVSSPDRFHSEINTKTFQSDSITFKVRPTEVPLFKRYLEFFSSWGVQYSIDYKPGSGVGLGTINSLPALIAERCRSEPNLAIDLIRAEIWKNEESGRPSSARRIENNESPFMGLDQPDTTTRHTWVERLSGCPQGIIDLLNSRACRSAIMFNDALTIDECQSLVSRLARCVFPFQCAHGRPSMIPILDLQSTGLLDSAELLDCETTGQDGAPLDFGTAFRSWRDTLG